MDIWIYMIKQVEYKKNSIPEIQPLQKEMEWQVDEGMDRGIYTIKQVEYKMLVVESRVGIQVFAVKFFHIQL